MYFDEVPPFSLEVFALIFFLYICVFPFVVGHYASTRGYSFASWVVISILLPGISFLMALSLPDKSAEAVAARRAKAFRRRVKMLPPEEQLLREARFIINNYQDLPSSEQSTLTS